MNITFNARACARSLECCAGFLPGPHLCPGIHRRCGTCMSTPTSHRVQCHSLQTIKLDVTTFHIVFECISNCLSMCEKTVFAIEIQTCVCRVDDYWLGYKLFCYAYYAHSFQHEAEFWQSKLGWWIVPRLSAFANFLVFFVPIRMFWQVYVWGCFLRLCSMVVIYRSTCLASTCRPPDPLPPCTALHLHATASACGDVLQVGVGRG